MREGRQPPKRSVMMMANAGGVVAPKRSVMMAVNGAVAAGGTAAGDAAALRRAVLRMNTHG